MDVLDQIQAGTGCKLMLITHHLGTVANFADRVAKVDAGHVTERLSRWSATQVREPPLRRT